jgi:hypothetical protein
MAPDDVLTARPGESVTIAAEGVLSGHLDSAATGRHRPLVLVYAVIDDSLPPWSIWAVMDVCVRREDAVRFIDESEAMRLKWRRGSGRLIRSAWLYLRER